MNAPSHLRPVHRQRICALLAALVTVLVTGLPVHARQGFDPDPASWTVLGADAQVTPTRDAGGRPAIEYRYRVGQGLLSLLVLPLSSDALVDTSGLSFSARADHLTSLTLSLEEQGGGRWTAAVTLSANRWQEVRLPFKDLVLAAGGDAPADANGRLDLDRVQRIAIVDTGAMLASGSSKMMQLFGMDTGERRLLIAAFGIAASGMPAPGSRLDGFDRANAPWSVFGATDARLAAEPPLRLNGLVIDYRKARGRVMSAIRQLSPGTLDGAAGIEVAAASRLETTLVLKVEQADGGRFEASFALPAGSTLRTVQMDSTAFKRSDDSSTQASRPQWASVTSLNLLDVGGLFSAGSDNRLWLQTVAASGGASVAAAGAAAGQADAAARATPPASMERVDVPGWSSWSKRRTPIFSGPFSLVGDPSVIRDGAVYRMAYTCFDPARKGPAICGATSSDGFAWTDIPVPGPPPGRLLATRPGKWDDTHETPFLLKFNGEYLLYFAGYRDRGGHFKSFPLQLGLARSRDGVHFERVGDDPILKVSPDGFDSDAIFSPTIVEHDGQLVMLYTAYCFTSCKHEPGVYLMAATSGNGRDWVKRTQPVLGKADVKDQLKANDGVAEAELVKAPDGSYYLFATLLYGGDRGHEIGVARAASPFGPWQFAPLAVVRRSTSGFDDVGPIAPSVLIEGNRVRMWFHAFSKRNTIQIGYAEAAWPLRTGP